MKMKCCFLLLLYFAVTCQGVYAGNNHDVKRGMLSYMAFIYYSDPSVVDVSGQRFVRSAVLIRSKWLVTTAMGPSLMDPFNGFPKKTLLARAGAIAIDPKFTLNEDEDEQEREIVQIVRPYNHSATQWWTTDISLMKTLLPFNMTSAVGIHNLNFKQTEFIDPKACSILVFAKKYGNVTEDKILMMLFVDLLTPSITNCGSHFTGSSMACAADSDENKNAVYDPEFCQGNSGGPLICSNDVVGLQTYIGNNCKQPHLYQLLFPWDDFITCSIEDKLREKQCAAICDVIYKDSPKTEVRITPPVTHDTARDIIAFLNVPSTTTTETTESIPVTMPTVTAMTTTGVFATYSEFVTEGTSIVNLSDVSTVKETALTTPDTTTNAMNASFSESVVTESMELLTIHDQTGHWLKAKHTSASWPKVKGEDEIAKTSAGVIMSMTKASNWPKEKLTGDKHKDGEEVERKTEVEAQHAPTLTKNRSGLNFSCFQTVLFGFVVLLCL